ncbi:Hypothetical protein PBC10988_2310 [Planctomycetales bacterium 10988]|nr:Hypothetical protein PBC10988_2310 [Planctomycetales bacterium 10988]
MVPIRSNLDEKQMSRKPEIGNVQLYPLRPLKKSDKNGYLLKFYCPILSKRIRKNCGTRDRRQARRVQRECQERLLNGEYVASGGAIRKADEKRGPQPSSLTGGATAAQEMTWEEAQEKYRAFKRIRLRDQSFQSLCSRIQMAERILISRCSEEEGGPGITLKESMTLASFEYLQEKLLEGAESRQDCRLPSTVNSIMGDVMAFARYCSDHEWIAKEPPLKDLHQEEVMRGRAITTEEFERMLASTSKVVGNEAAESWNFLLRVLWESGFRVADVLNFTWDEETKIHPKWAGRRQSHSTLVIPSTQKNKKHEEIPMLPGLEKLLENIPESERSGEVVKLLPLENSLSKSSKSTFKPNREDLVQLLPKYSNCAIAEAFQVSEAAVRKRLRNLGLERQGRIPHSGAKIPRSEIERIKKRKRRKKPWRSNPSKAHVSRVISAIGEEAGVVVRQPDDGRKVRIKYASAHDLRRSLAERLYNQGISADTLMVIMRHKDFATTRKYYAAKRRAESAATEIHKLLSSKDKKEGLVGG